jgi:hypothetical protein
MQQSVVTTSACEGAVTLITKVRRIVIQYYEILMKLCNRGGKIRNLMTVQG